MQVRVLMLRQDDPKKCTAARMVRFDLARAVKRTADSTILLDPFAYRFLVPGDRALANSITAVDCSWNRAGPAFSGRFRGTARRLPPLLAGNSVNYAKRGKLSTAEAAAAALYILGDAATPRLILDKFRWGHTFLELNQSLLDDYAAMKSQEQIPGILAEHGMGQPS